MTEKPMETIQARLYWKVDTKETGAVYLMDEYQYNEFLSTKRVPDSCPNLCDYAPTNTFKGEIRDYSNHSIYVYAEAGPDGLCGVRETDRII